jgi:hypothetical protein
MFWTRATLFIKNYMTQTLFIITQKKRVSNFQKMGVDKENQHYVTAGRENYYRESLISSERKTHDLGGRLELMNPLSCWS